MAVRVERENAEHDKAQVADGRVGHEALQISLHRGDERAIHDADDGENGDRRRHAVRRVGEERQAETQDAVGAELQHHARENHGAGRGRFGVRVGQPGVQREERNFDRERQEERAEQQQFGARRERELPGLHQRSGCPAGRTCRSCRRATGWRPASGSSRTSCTE